MLSLYDRATIEHAPVPSLEPKLRDLLTERVAQSQAAGLLDLTHFLIVQPGDTEADVFREIGLSPLVNPIDGAHYGSPKFKPWWDWLQDHGGCFELIITVGNSGFAYILLIQNADGVQPELLAMCRSLAGKGEA